MALQENFKKSFKKIVKTKADTDAEIAADSNHSNMTARFRFLFLNHAGISLPVEESWNHKHVRHGHGYDARIHSPPHAASQVSD